MMSTARRGRGRGRGRARRENVTETLQTTVPGSSSSSAIKDFNCPACQLSFNKESDMLNHKMTHSELYDYECGQCDLVFEKLDLLKSHFYSTHMGSSTEGVGEGRCETENAVQNDAVDLQNSSSVWGDNDNTFGDDDDDGYDGGGAITPDEEDDRDSSVLEKKVTSAATSAVTCENESSSSGVKKFQCDKCPKSYKYKQDLTAHMTTHTGDRPYVCSECGKSFSNYRTMTDHLKRHNNEFQYFCEVFGCGKGFVKKQDRDRHEIRAHVPVSQRPKDESHQCSVCDKYFTQKVHLKKHMKIHSNTRELPFPCKLCGKRFGKKSGLETHMMSIKHGGTGVSYRNKKKPKKSVGVSKRGRKKTVPARFVQEESSADGEEDEQLDTVDNVNSDDEYLPPGEKRHDEDATSTKRQSGYVTPPRSGPTLTLATSSPPQQTAYQPQKLAHSPRGDSSGTSGFHHHQQQGVVVQQHANTGYWRNSGAGGQQQQQFGVYPHQQQQQVIGVPIAVLTLQDAFQNGYVIGGGGNANAS